MHISFYCHSSSEALDMQLPFIAMGFGKSQQWLLLYKHTHCVLLLTLPGGLNEFEWLWCTTVFVTPLKFLMFVFLMEEKKSGKIYSVVIF